MKCKKCVSATGWDIWFCFAPYSITDLYSGFIDGEEINRIGFHNVTATDIIKLIHLKHFLTVLLAWPFHVNFESNYTPKYF